MSEAAMDKVTVTEADKDASVDLAHCIGMSCEEFTNGGADILVQAFARHRHAAMLEGVKLGIAEALRVCNAYRAFTGDEPLWPDEPGTSISLLDPAAIVEGVE